MYESTPHGTFADYLLYRAYQYMWDQKHMGKVCIEID
jgi:hypothetical protein